MHAKLNLKENAILIDLLYNLIFIISCLYLLTSKHSVRNKILSRGTGFRGINVPSRGMGFPSPGTGYGIVNLPVNGTGNMYIFLIVRWYLIRRTGRSFVLFECWNTLFYLVQVILSLVTEYCISYNDIIPLAFPSFTTFIKF
jgi:hypothetical protein